MDSFYVSDLDGTLLGNDGRLSDYSRQTLNQMLNEGLSFTVASARSVVSIREILGDLPLTLPIIEFNGAFISDFTSGRHQTIHSIPPGITEDLIRSITGHGQLPFVSAFDGEKDRLHYAGIRNEGMAHYLRDRREKRDPRLHSVEKFDGVLNQEVVCLTVIGNSGDLKPLEAEILAGHGPKVETHFYEDTYCPGWHWLTIHDRRATKDQAIRVLQERQGLGQKELVVFGDHINDIKMFKLAERAIAVENAQPEVKAHAHRIIASNQRDSVVHFIQEEWKAGS